MKTLYFHLNGAVHSAMVSESVSKLPGNVRIIGPVKVENPAETLPADVEPFDSLNVALASLVSDQLSANVADSVKAVQTALDAGDYMTARRYDKWRVTVTQSAGDEQLFTLSLVSKKAWTDFTAEQYNCSALTDKVNAFGKYLLSVLKGEKGFTGKQFERDLKTFYADHNMPYTVNGTRIHELKACFKFTGSAEKDEFTFRKLNKSTMPLFCAVLFADDERVATVRKESKKK